jgi:hypothetical protein
MPSFDLSKLFLSCSSWIAWSRLRAPDFVSGVGSSAGVRG